MSYQILPYVLAIAPLAFAATVSAVWWNALARPWVFLAAGAASLYAVMALSVFAAIFVGPGFGSYFLETPVQPTIPRSSSSIDSVDVGAALALVVFLAVGFGILWALKQWLSKP